MQAVARPVTEGHRRDPDIGGIDLTDEHLARDLTDHDRGLRDGGVGQVVLDQLHRIVNPLAR